MGGARRESHDPLRCESALRQPLCRAVLGSGAEAELGRPAVWLRVEPTRRLEVALGDRPGRAPAVDVQLGGDEQ